MPLVCANYKTAETFLAEIQRLCGTSGTREDVAYYSRHGHYSVYTFISEVIVGKLRVNHSNAAPEGFETCEGLETVLKRLGYMLVEAEIYRR